MRGRLCPGDSDAFWFVNVQVSGADRDALDASVNPPPSCDQWVENGAIVDPLFTPGPTN